MAKKKKAKAKKAPTKDNEKAKGDSESRKGDKKKSDEKKSGASEAEGSVGKRFSLLTIMEIVFAIGVLVLLSFVVHWLAALSIASATFVFLDAAINHVNKIKPSSDESRFALMAWSLVGFIPLVGVVAYSVLRKKLASAPAGKVATGKEAVETVKRRMRAVPIPAAIVVAVVAIAVALLWLKDPFSITFGTGLTPILRIEGTTSDDIYTVGTVCVRLVSSKPIEGFADLDWKLFLLGRDAAVRTGTVKAQVGSNKTIWGWRLRVRSPGDYRVVVVDNTDRIVKQGDFRTVPRSR